MNHSTDSGPSTADQTTRTRRFFMGAGLPVFLLAAVAVYEAFLLALVFAPEGAGWWGAFAREFRIWCFSYDPRTGGMEWSAVGMMVLEPVFVVIVAVVLWRRALATLRSVAVCLSHWQSALAGMAVSSVAALALLSFARGSTEDALPAFPGERIRTQLIPPAFRLTDQTGRECGLEELRGRVVLITGIYAMCSTSCPQILIETRKLLDSLPAESREQLRVVALSLNPEYDTTELMAALAAGYGFTHPEFRYLNGDPAVMHGVLEQLQFARVPNQQTGLLDHANLFILVDAQGRIAYRFNLNPRHQVWLREGIVALTAEAAQFEKARVAGL
jgi:protein SCO1